MTHSFRYLREKKKPYKVEKHQEYCEYGLKSIDTQQKLGVDQNIGDPTLIILSGTIILSLSKTWDDFLPLAN